MLPAGLKPTYSVGSGCPLIGGQPSLAEGAPATRRQAPTPANPRDFKRISEQKRPRRGDESDESNESNDESSESDETTSQPPLKGRAARDGDGPTARRPALDGAKPGGLP
jgi:hypothetical protein